MKKPRLAFLCLLLILIPMQALIAAEIRQEAPNCVLAPLGESEQSEQVAISQLQGKVVYVDFWASWCTPCAKSFPFLNELHHEFNDQELHIVGINLDEKLSDAQDFLARIPASFDIMTDPHQQCAKSFDLKGMPSSFLIDKNGVIRYVHLGFRSGDAEQLRVQVEKILKEEAAKS
ncbi:MAG: TlpA family protein disulfide reductase [Candidatus Nitrosoglobus sp.]|jgi:thiol-disulfide isomerase/thioredoxin